MAEWAAGKPPSLVTRHIFLIRHGQYHEHHKEDQHKTLTPLGARQAKLTGMRIARIIRHNQQSRQQHHTHFKSFAVSDLTRAKQTADIILEELEAQMKEHNAEHPDSPWTELNRNEPDSLLNEGFPGVCSHSCVTLSCRSNVRR
jgi:broad specificity phosphatase PhoE